MGLFKQIGPLELIIILAIVLLLFGVGRLGRLGKDLGEGIAAFRKGLKGEESEEATEANTSEAEEA
jgi:sec-independent protein translocase protein TatA